MKTFVSLWLCVCIAFLAYGQDEGEEIYIDLDVELMEGVVIEEIPFTGRFYTLRMPVGDLDYPFLDTIPDLALNLSRTNWAIHGHSQYEVLCDLTQTSLFIFSGNEVDDFPQSCRQWQSLLKLELTDNQFSTFPEVICELSSLRELYLGDDFGHPDQGDRLPDYLPNDPSKKTYHADRVTGARPFPYLSDTASGGYGRHVCLTHLDP
jgi:hypothetical protein